MFHLRGIIIYAFFLILVFKSVIYRCDSLALRKSGSDNEGRHMLEKSNIKQYVNSGETIPLESIHNYAEDDIQNANASLISITTITTLTPIENIEPAQNESTERPIEEEDNKIQNITILSTTSTYEETGELDPLQHLSPVISTAEDNKFSNRINTTLPITTIQLPTTTTNKKNETNSESAEELLGEEDGQKVPDTSSIGGQEETTEEPEESSEEEEEIESVKNRRNPGQKRKQGFRLLENKEKRK